MTTFGSENIGHPDDQEYAPVEIDEAVQEQFNVTLRQTAKRLAFMLAPGATKEEADSFSDSYSDSVCLSVCDDEKIFMQIPPLVENVRGKGRPARTIYFDLPTYEDLCDHFTNPPRVTNQDVARLYLGTGVISSILQERVAPEDTEQVEQFWEIMRDHQPLDEAVDKAAEFDTATKSILKNALMHYREDRMARTNAMRFALGLLFMQSEEPLSNKSSASDISFSYETRLTDESRSGLLVMLRNRPVYKRILLTLGNTPEGADRVFADHISDLHLAACFPMRWDELRKILQVCKIVDPGQAS